MISMYNRINEQAEHKLNTWHNLSYVNGAKHTETLVLALDHNRFVSNSKDFLFFSISILDMIFSDNQEKQANVFLKTFVTTLHDKSCQSKEPQNLLCPPVEKALIYLLAAY